MVVKFDTLHIAKIENLNHRGYLTNLYKNRSEYLFYQNGGFVMEKEIDERFGVFNSGKNFTDSLGRLKSHWWEKERKPELERNIKKAMESAKNDMDKETFEIMKELVKVVKIKKTGDYKNNG